MMAPIDGAIGMKININTAQTTDTNINTNSWRGLLSIPISIPPKYPISIPLSIVLANSVAY